MTTMDSSNGIWDIVGNVVDFGTQAYNNYKQDSARDQYSQAMRDKEQYNYDQAKANHDAYLQYAQELQTHNSANAAAAQAAHAQSEQARLAALANAQGILQSHYGKAQQQLDPYTQMGERLIPPVEATYRAGLTGSQDLLKAMMTPENMAKMNKSVMPMDQIYGSIPEWAKK